jgi:uncharacterized protein (DUF849 family)
MLQACLNGARTPAEHPGLPVSPDALGAAAASAVAAGAQSLHVHPKSASGVDSLVPAAVASAVRAVRLAVPGVPVGATTGAWAAPDAGVRRALVESWDVLPDFASVNWHEDGAPELAELLIDRGVGVEAGLWTGAAAATFAASPLAPRCLRVLGEPMEQDVAAALVGVDAIAAAVRHLRLPILMHGVDAAAWPVLEAALARGFDVRIGLEDALTLPDGSPALDNAALVSAAVRLRTDT